jgi:hypothetical protein
MSVAMQALCRVGGNNLQFVKRRPLRRRRLLRLGNAVERQVRNRRCALAAES